MNPCPFCTLAKDQLLFDNDYVRVIYDGYPVNEGHALIIPKRHVASYFELTNAETQAIAAALKSMKKILEERFHPDGYNIGINIGTSAGQTVGHVHVHIIPRYEGDMEDPRGGVRGVIPDKQKYGDGS